MTHRDKSDQPQKHRHRKMSKRKMFDKKNRTSDIIIACCIVLGVAIIAYLVVTGAHFGGNM